MTCFTLVDVFSPTPFGGNPLPVFIGATGLSPTDMLAVTREFRQFESIFLEPAQGNVVRARIFDLLSELRFAGHPLLGAAAALQASAGAAGPTEWLFDLGERLVPVEVESAGHRYRCTLDQGAARFDVHPVESAKWAARFSLAEDGLRGDLPLEIGSTGLRYLVVPVVAGALDGARVTRDLTPSLTEIGAEFAVLFDPTTCEMRH